MFTMPWTTLPVLASLAHFCNHIPSFLRPRRAKMVDYLTPHCPSWVSWFAPTFPFPLITYKLHLHMTIFELEASQRTQGNQTQRHTHTANRESEREREREKEKERERERERERVFGPVKGKGETHLMLPTLAVMLIPPTHPLKA